MISLKISGIFRKSFAEILVPAVKVCEAGSKHGWLACR